MKQLTIYTRRYSQLLEDFAARATASGWINASRAAVASGVLTVYCQYESVKPAFSRGLMNLLADIVVQENPIYQHSSKLKDLADDLRKTPLYYTGLRGLTRYVKHNRALHLEGYVTFRMSDYREKLDMMSYSLIKKLKLAQKD